MLFPNCNLKNTQKNPKIESKLYNNVLIINVSGKNAFSKLILDYCYNGKFTAKIYLNILKNEESLFFLNF